MSEREDGPVKNERAALFVRLAIGLFQGLALYGCHYVSDNNLWPATDRFVFLPLLLTLVFVPLLIEQGLGNMRRRTLAIWAGVAAVLTAGFSYYDVWHALPGAASSDAMAWFFTAVFLFAAHALVACGDADRRIVARYAVLFDLILKQAVQICVAAAFVGVFWGVLYLGAALFDLIHLDFFRKTIEHAWFYIPVTALAAAASFHVTDSRGALVRGVRTLALALLGWLLPVIALIGAMFLASLIFTGLKPLWETRHATAMLLTAAWVLILLINAAYQGGDAERKPHVVQRFAGSLGAVLLAAIVALAGYALWLRVAQYGWTAERIFSAAAVAVFGFVAAGYAVAVALPGAWLKPIERWNVYALYLGLAVVFVLFTPIADPLRLSAADQVHRLTSGAVKPEAFDFSYLRWESGRFGLDALKRLAASHDPAVAKPAAEALAQKDRLSLSERATKEDIAARIVVYPQGKSLPASFLAQDWTALTAYYGISACLTGENDNAWRCAARIADFDGDGKDDILLFGAMPANDRSETFAVLLVWDGKTWRWAATLEPAQQCPGDIGAILAGKAKPVPRIKPLLDLMMDGRRLTLVPKAAPPECK